VTQSSRKAELVVVTGASAGIGAATARDLASRGFHVLAGVRRDSDADPLRSAGVEPVILDITDPEHIASLAARIDGDPHGRPLRAVVNNAGVAALAPVEALPIDEWRRMLEVNLFGAIAVTQALLPALLRNEGRVVNISSVGGKVSMAGWSPYASAKFALEAVSDSLRRELAARGVQVVVVEPGFVRTEMPDHAIAIAHRLAARMPSGQQARYGALMGAVTAQLAASAAAGMTADRSARGVVRAVTARRPRARYTVGGEAAMITRIIRVLPDRMLDRMLAANLRPHYPKNPA
jgi:NAD(P)-dependent dehydrogenase (short-subunit alcohol dehydrogenase family)